MTIEEGPCAGPFLIVARPRPDDSAQVSVKASAGALSSLLMPLDTTPYHSVPELPLQTLVVLTHALAALTPETAPAYVDGARAKMVESASEAEAAMIAKLRARGTDSLVADLALDAAVDELWTLLHQRIHGWTLFERASLDFLLDADLNFEQARAKAKRASALSERLFGEGDLAMLGRNYTEQAQLMRHLLGRIETEGLAADIDALAGPELLPMLRASQSEYEAMIIRRDTQAPAPGSDLRALRTRLRRRVLTYAALVLTMLDESQPKLEQLVADALEPMIRFSTPPPVTLSETGVSRTS